MEFSSADIEIGLNPYNVPTVLLIIFILMLLRLTREFITVCDLVITICIDGG